MDGSLPTITKQLNIFTQQSLSLESPRKVPIDDPNGSKPAAAFNLHDAGIEEVYSWLNKAGMSEVATTFKEQGFDGRSLLELGKGADQSVIGTAIYLQKEVGISKSGEALKLLYMVRTTGSMP